MITILIIAILFTMFLYDETFSSIIGGLVVGSLLGLVVASAFGFLFDTEVAVQSSERIYALQDNGGIAGSFFLGTGSVSSTQYYHYLAGEEGGKVQKSIPVSDAIVYEGTASESAHIDTMQVVFVNKKRILWAFPIGMPKSRIYIPNGSIKYGYNVDLE
jgi:hypothetical protein